MVFTEKYNEVEAELRKVVDDLMRQELELLQAALDRDRATKGKKAKKSSKKARRSGKKGKKKKEKDLTPDRTTESLFEELVMNGIIKRCPNTPLNSFLGDPSYVERRSGINPAPGDIRQVMMEYAVLPLGSETVHNYGPCVRSFLLAGPKSSGKRLLVNAICYETGATLFDLTPQNLAGKYPGVRSGIFCAEFDSNFCAFPFFRKVRANHANAPGLEGESLAAAFSHFYGRRGATVYEESPKN